METEVRTLKQELNSARIDLKTATKRCRELIKELDIQKTYHKSERNLRDQQLSKILRALLMLESRLRQEQKTIRQQLSEKDNVIRIQKMEIAKLRRKTKNYIKINKREQINNNINDSNELNQDKEDIDNNIFNDVCKSGLDDNNIGIHIHRLKRELINKIGSYDIDNNYEFGVKKTDSFAGSDVSKESIGSENTDASILTTTTEDSPSVLSTEGFCEGESTDVSPGSTLNKSSRRKNLNSENDRTILDCHDDNDDDDDDDKYSKRRLGVLRTEPLDIFNNKINKISRSDSKDDGMDCNFISEEEDDDDDNAEPIYVNSCNDINTKNYKNNEDNSVKILDDSNFNTSSLELEPQDKSAEETSGNWYSDQDEDRITEEVCRNNTYRPNSNHNSVLECVNQILLRDMEDEENVLSVSRKFKHRGRIVSFQPARLSDIESVGSEMERRNSEEVSGDKEINNFEGGSEDDYGMRNNDNSSTITRPASECIDSESCIEEEINCNGLARAIPIVVIEPDIDEEINCNITLPSSPNPSIKSNNSNNSLLRLESIEEKTCLSMSTKGLTIAKNLDYEDIESLPDLISLSQKTPPALPPKPQFRTNTLILKKIPSPSFLIDETKNKYSPNRDNYAKKFYKPNTKIGTSSAKSLVFHKKLINDNENNNLNDLKDKKNIDIINKNKNELTIPRVTNIVRHFEEFKIGGDTEIRVKSKDRKLEIDDIDIRQNFEEFNFDDCDLSDDPDRLDGDGSDRLVNNLINQHDNDLLSTSTTVTSDNNNLNSNNNNNSNGIYDHFLEATGLSTKSILTPIRLISNHRGMLKPKDIKYKNKIKSNTIGSGSSQTHVKHWTGPFV